MSAAQKISRLALGYPEEPTLVVYRTREDTSQDYHVEGLPFGTRGGMLVPHVFPSDGEYTLTVTPIFGDNMSPTGFGSVPCERLEMLLDGERLELHELAGRRPQDAGQLRPRRRQTGGRRRSGQAGPKRSSAARRHADARPLQDHGRHAHARRHVPRHQLRAAARSRQALHALDAADRSDARLHVLPARRHDPHRRSVQRHAGEGLAEPPQDLRLHAEDAADETACARRIVTNLATVRLPPSGDGGRRRPADGVLRARAARRRTSTRASRWRSRASSPRRSSSTASKKSRARRCDGRDACRRYRISDVDLASRLSFFLWSPAPTRSC